MEASVKYDTEIREILGKSYISPSYLDRFSLDGSYIPNNVSVIISTYNRSPYPPERGMNPLGWCLDSLLHQKTDNIGEIIVVDDCSRDYTKEVVEMFREQSDIPVIYLKNKENIGSPKSRNIGMKESDRPFIQFLDDDCIVSPYMIFGANYSFNGLPEEAAVVHLPTYLRRRTPNKIVHSEMMGFMDFDNGAIGGNFDAFPSDYKDFNGMFLDDSLKILKPVEIKNLAGVFTVKREAFKEAGMFPEWFTWGNGYREETELALSLQDKGYRLFFTPDPKFHCVHLKYGYQKERRRGDTNGSYNGLTDLVEESNIGREETGNRVPPKEWVYDYIISTYVIFKRRGHNAADSFMEHMRHSFVEGNDIQAFVNSAGIGLSSAPYEERKEIYERAVKNGNALVERLQNKTLNPEII